MIYSKGTGGRSVFSNYDDEDVRDTRKYVSPLECCWNCSYLEPSFNLAWCRRHSRNVNSNERCLGFISMTREIREKISFDEYNNKSDQT